MIAVVFLRIVIIAAIVIAVLSPSSAVAEDSLLNLLLRQSPKQKRIVAETYSQVPSNGPIPKSRPNVTRMLIDELAPLVPERAKKYPYKGHNAYCKRYPDDCVRQPVVKIVILDDHSLSVMIAVNAAVNQEIAGVEDNVNYGVDEWWEYPDQGFGDCEDYALEKRRRLMTHGFPVSSLLITVVQGYDRDGKDIGGHAILTVRTDRGDLVLDSLHSDVLPWQYVRHKFLSRQSPAHSGKWDELSDKRGTDRLLARFNNQQDDQNLALIDE